MRASSWGAAWATGRFLKPYMVGVEDPFDGTDNCARTVSPLNAQNISGRLTATASVLQRLQSREGVWRCPAALTFAQGKCTSALTASRLSTWPQGRRLCSWEVRFASPRVLHHSAGAMRILILDHYRDAELCSGSTHS